MLVLVVFLGVVVVLVAVWLACGGGTAKARAERRVVRELRRQDQARLNSPLRRKD